MTDKASLIALKERVDAATGPDCELDVAVWCAVTEHHKPMGPPGFYTFDDGNVRWRGWKKAPAVTSSVDAANALALRRFPGAYIESGTNGTAMVRVEDVDHCCWAAATQALAIVSAALAALIAEGA